MSKNYQKNSKLNISSVVIPAILGAIATIAAAYFSYSAGVNAIKIPLIATQTAEAKNLSNISVSNTINSSTPIAVDSMKDWQSSNLFVLKGDTIKVSVVGGKWTIAQFALSNEDIDSLPENLRASEILRNLWSYNTGEGHGNSICPDIKLYDCPVPTAPLGSLVGRIALGKPFLIGNTKIFVASENGPLFLRINDGESEGTRGLHDNSGILAVEIEINE